MELRTTQRLRRNEQIAKAATKKAEPSEAPKAQSALKQVPADKLSVSRQALAWLDQQAELDRQREMRRQERQSNGLSALESKKRALDGLDQKLKVLNKCHKIAASIMKGNHVPPEDLRYLMEHDQAGYKLAMAMRRHNPDPKDEKSVLDEEDKKAGPTEQAAGGDAPSASAPEASSGGGEASGPTE